MAWKVTIFICKHYKKTKVQKKKEKKVEFDFYFLH